MVANIMAAIGGIMRKNMVKMVGSAVRDRRKRNGISNGKEKPSAKMTLMTVRIIERIWKRVDLVGSGLAVVWALLVVGAESILVGSVVLFVLLVGARFGELGFLGVNGSEMAWEGMGLVLPDEVGV